MEAKGDQCVFQGRVYSVSGVTRAEDIESAPKHCYRRRWLVWQCHTCSSFFAALGYRQRCLPPINGESVIALNWLRRKLKRVRYYGVFYSRRGVEQRQRWSLRDVFRKFSRIRDRATWFIGERDEEGDSACCGRLHLHRREIFFFRHKRNLGKERHVRSSRTTLMGSRAKFSLVWFYCVVVKN